MSESEELTEQEKDKLSRKIRNIGCSVILAIAVISITFILVCESEDDHCTLEYLDNPEGMPSVNRAIKQRLKNPETFRHVKTDLEFPGDGSGPNAVWVDFLITNEYGMLTKGTAYAFIDGSSDSCIVNDISI